MHPARMSLRLRTHFENLRLARMSSGTYCIIRDLGPVKGGKGMKHHEVVVTFSLKALSASIRSARRHRGRKVASRVGKSGINETDLLENRGS
jgi:hypothetical protein